MRLLGWMPAPLTPSRLETLVSELRGGVEAELRALGCSNGFGAAAGEQSTRGSYPAHFASLRMARIAALASRNGNGGRRAALFAQALQELQSFPGQRGERALTRLEALRLDPAAVNDDATLALVFSEAEADARAALDRFEKHTLVARLAPFVVLAFFAVSLPAMFWDVAERLRSQASLAETPTTLLGAVSELVLTPGILGGLFGLLGALVSIAMEVPAPSAAPHWTLARERERTSRLWMGALIGTVVAAMAPLLLGDLPEGPDQFTRLMAVATAFGASQDAFYSRLLARVEVRS